MSKLPKKKQGVESISHIIPSPLQKQRPGRALLRFMLPPKYSHLFWFEPKEIVDGFKCVYCGNYVDSFKGDRGQRTIFARYQYLGYFSLIILKPSPEPGAYVEVQTRTNHR